MSFTVFPIQPNVQITEAAWTGLGKMISKKESRRETGFDISAGAGLTLNIGTGIAVVSGMRHEITVAETLALTDDSDNRIWLQADGTLYDNVSDTPTAADDFLLANVTTAAGSITLIVASVTLKTPPLGVTWDGRRKNFTGLSSLTVSQLETSLGTLTLEAGLYWVRALVYAQGTVLSAGENWQLKFTKSGGSSFTLPWLLGFLNHGDEGSNDDSAWRTDSAFVTFTATSNNHTHPTHIIGMLDLPDGATVGVSAVTSSQFSIVKGWLTAIKIA